MTWAPCAHLTAKDHARHVDGTRLWRCTSCRVEGPWAKGWRYHGNVECRECDEAQIDVVLCPACPDSRDLVAAAQRQERKRARAIDGG